MANHLMLLGAVGQMPAEAQQAVGAAAAELRAVVAKYEPAGPIALALVGLEFAMKAEDKG